MISLMLFFLTTSSFASIDFHPHLSPDQIFEKETQAVLLQVDLKPWMEPSKPASVTLIRTDAQGNEEEQIGELFDNGKRGDGHPSDLIFSRKMQLSRKKPETLFFKILLEQGSARKESEVFTFEILRRPNFLEMMSMIWFRWKTQKKIKNHESFSELQKELLQDESVESVKLNSKKDYIMIKFKNGNLTSVSTESYQSKENTHQP